MTLSLYIDTVPSSGCTPPLILYHLPPHTIPHTNYTVQPIKTKTKTYTYISTHTAGCAIHGAPCTWQGFRQDMMVGCPYDLHRVQYRVHTLRVFFGYWTLVLTYGLLNYPLTCVSYCFLANLSPNFTAG